MSIENRQKFANTNSKIKHTGNQLHQGLCISKYPCIVAVKGSKFIALKRAKNATTGRLTLWPTNR